jgi:pimeloyl-ACP methyl ester carboxylesterase
LSGGSRADYVDDVKSVVRSLPSTPVLIGHSMGRFVVQKYLEANDAPAAVLIVSAPPARSPPFRAVPDATLPVADDPKPRHGQRSARLQHPGEGRGLFFSAATPESDVRRHAAMIGNESTVALDTMKRDALRPGRITNLDVGDGRGARRLHHARGST